jgi:predicted 3-demethylubiquinone-9 3-methyltransferase (glyoxalase superfamily)
LNGGPEFTFNEAISFQVSCKDQQELDTYWSKLSEGGEEGPCGWLKDKYGVSWQVIPAALPELLGNADPKRSQAVMRARNRAVQKLAAAPPRVSVGRLRVPPGRYVTSRSSPVATS